MNKYWKFATISLASFALTALIATRRKGTSSQKAKARAMGYTKYQKYPIFMDAILKGESRGYNDYNWGCKGTSGSFLYGRTKTGTIPKKLTDLTITEIQSYQSACKLYAVGRYQMIPSTLQAMVTALRISKNSKFTEEIQDRLGTALVDIKRKEISEYLNGKVDDTEANLTRAVYYTAKEWSSVANPYTGVSYYSSDRASTSADSAKKALREQRKAIV